MPVDPAFTALLRRPRVELSVLVSRFLADHVHPGAGARDIARAALRALEDAQRLMAQGRLVLIYPEGTRSRTGELGPFLKATARRMTLPRLLVVPLAPRGSDGCNTLEDDRLRPAEIHAHFGPAVAEAQASGLQVPVHG